jgi:hypothetical protein
MSAYQVAQIETIRCRFVAASQICRHSRFTPATNALPSIKSKSSHAAGVNVTVRVCYTVEYAERKTEDNAQIA